MSSSIAQVITRGEKKLIWMGMDLDIIVGSL